MFTSHSVPLRRLITTLAVILVGAAVGLPTRSHAQDISSTQADELVSFLPSVSFDRFITALNRVSERSFGKPVVYLGDGAFPIGVPLQGVPFRVALERVANSHNLVIRETPRYLIVEEIMEDPSEPTSEVEEPNGSDEGSAREIRIHATLFETDLTKVRELGIQWSALFGGGDGGQGSSGGQGGSGGRNGISSGFGIRTDRFMSEVDGFVVAPEVVPITRITQTLRFLETEGAGETVARPRITVQSGHEGRIQIGTDVPVQTRDFSGNTITQLLSTGIIVNVTPTLHQQIVRTESRIDTLDYVHLKVRVEKSGSRPSAGGMVIDRNVAETQVLLLNGEQTVIGGLVTNETVTTRKGIPLLKDLPGWFFGLRYVFGTTHRTVTQKELLIILRADVLDTLTVRSGTIERVNAHINSED